MTVWRMHISCSIPKARNTHSKYVILIDFPPKQRLHERSSALRLYEGGSKSFLPDQLQGDTNKTTLLFFNIVSLYFNTYLYFVHFLLPVFPVSSNCAVSLYLCAVDLSCSPVSLRGWAQKFPA